MKKGQRGALVWGLLLIFLGVGFLLDTANLLNFDKFLGDWWPVVFIVIAVAEMISGKSKSALLWGIIGIVLLLSTLGILKVSFWSVLWPLILIIIGIGLVFRLTFVSSGDPGELINSFTAFGAVEKKADSHKFQGANIFAIFGGSKLDLRNAKLSERGGYVDVAVLFGGAEILVPKDMPVKIDAFALFGGSEDKRTEIPTVADEPYLTIQGIVLFGGIEIKN